MSTPSMIFTIWLKNICMVLWLLWVSTLVISRIYILHEAYNFESAKLVDEIYLLKLCKVIASSSHSHVLSIWNLVLYTTNHSSIPTVVHKWYEYLWLRYSEWDTKWFESYNDWVLLFVKSHMKI
jgi:hypothetical protein